ncbi:MAG: InlB B-repeat-containing protein [Firmicutes bacterium]|nr:InlB B-repeat-containing protein [Bacillota bacterium]
MNYKKIFVFILCVLLAVAAAAPFSGAFASEDNDAPPVDLPTGEENDTEEEAPVTVIEDVADGTVVTVGEPEPAADPIADPAAAPTPEVKTLTDNYVTVTGLLPADTELQAERISDPFAQPAPKKSGKNLFKSALRLNADTDAAPAADEQSDSAEDSWKAIAFYDIKLVKSGQALQPDGTVTVNIENVPLTDTGKTVSVKHFLDSEDAIRAALRDGSAEPVRDAAYAKAFPAAAAAAEAVTGEQGVVYVETITKADGLRVDGTTVSFPARSFSIYAVGESQPKNRLNVIFHQANSTETISVLVKKDDLADLSAVFVDPGYGTLNAGQYFRGWTEDENDTAETGMFFDAVCERVRTMLNANNVADEQTLELWPLIYKIYKVTYKDERGSIIRDDDCVFRDSDPATYTINQDYTPISQDAKFMGWQVESGSLTPGPDQGSGSETYYLNGTEVTLSGDVVLKVYSPSGYWITFEENGKGASYTPPKFVKHNDPTVAPDSNPVRPGYSFGGWYTNQACTDGNEFTFGGTIDEPKTLFAKWIANETAGYTIIIWKQNVTGTSYDFEESLTLNGDVGAIIDTVTAAGTGNAYHAIVNGADKTYTGFHLNGYDTGVQIAPEGNTVLNVYYDRDVVTLNFYVYGTETNYIYTETTGNSGTQYGQVNSEYVQLTYRDGKWYYNTGEQGYVATTSTSTNPTQYGWVNNGYVELTRHGRGNSGNPYYWTYVSNYSYTATNSRFSFDPRYGYVNGEYVELSWYTWGGYWTYNGTRYTGTCYIRNDITATYNGTRYIYQDVTAEYTGIRYTRESSRWTLWKSYTGLYGSTLADNGYTWPTDYNWYSGHDDYGNTSGTRTTFLDAFMPSDGASQENFYGRTATTSTRQVIFYKQNADLNGYTEANRVQTSGTGGFNISDKYNGFKAYQYRVDGGTWQNVGTYNSTTGYYGDTVSYNNTLEIRFNRIAPSINYMDGAYFYRAETNLNLPSRGQLKVVEDVNFGSNLSSYNKGGTDYYAPTYDGYVLEGWYTDSSCTQPYTFTTMPEGGITVYAKWVQIEYRVFLHSNVPQDDTSLSWGDDSMCYRAAYGEPINDGVMKTGFRQDYEIIGWYTDEACTQPFNFATALTDATVKTDYDKTVDMTDPIDKYGVLGSSPYNSDINGYNGGDRFWITRKLDLYAKWRSKLEGNAKGIHVVYDANGGSGAPTDDTLYLDQADAYAGDKSTPPAGSTDEFKYWIVQQWNGSAFVDTDEHVYAGGIFTVHKANAHEEDIPDSGDGVTKKYTVQLKAFYGPIETPDTTFI